MTPEEENADYLQQNPAAESALWSEWVGVVCGWQKIAPPNTTEWQALKANFYSGKMPITSVDELKAMRLKPAPVQQEPVAFHEVGLTRDINGVCIVTVNGREAIRDSSDIISHFATLDWFASDSLKKHFTKELVLSKKPERDCDSMEVCLYNRGWNDAIDSKLYTSPPAQPLPTGFIDAVVEAAAILSEIDPDHAPKNMRWPLADELDGFVTMLKDEYGIGEKK